MNAVDLFVRQENIEAARSLGWGGFCQVDEFGKGYKKPTTPDDVLCGVLLKSDVLKGSQRALDMADLVIVDGRIENTAREASEALTVDLMVNNELNEERDPLYMRSSGLDHVMCAFMAERSIGYIVNFNNLINTYGVSRTKLIGRVAQNIRLCLKYQVKVVFSSAATDLLGLRAPQDLVIAGTIFGVSAEQARDFVYTNPAYFIQKANNRNNPDVITNGLFVKEWGKQERKPKRKQGWL